VLATCTSYIHLPWFAELVGALFSNLEIEVHPGKKKCNATAFAVRRGNQSARCSSQFCALQCVASSHFDLFVQFFDLRQSQVEDYLSRIIAFWFLIL